MNASDSARGIRFLVLVAALGAAWTLGVNARAQIPAVRSDVRGARGLPISPVYEGWYEIDGKKYVLFAYYNRNLEQIVDVPIGPGNHVSPGPQDQGQPTRFFPGVYYGVFATTVPKDPPAAEVTWTLTANGQTVSIPVFLDPLYFISPQREDGGAYPGNLPPVVKFDPAGASGQGPNGITVSRTATASRPLALDAWVTDDGLPPPRRESRAAEGRRAPGRQEPPQGLALTWQVYRASGSGTVTFSDQMPAVEQGKAHTTVTFSQPGDYMLHLLAIDSRTANRCCWTNGYVKVKVDGGAQRP
jgi:hypothetical protein